MKAIERSNISRQRWDELVRSSPDGWVYALSAWHDVIARVDRWQLQDQGFGVENGGKLVAVVPLHYSPPARSLASSGWGYTGPVLAEGLGRRFENRLKSLITAEMRARAERLGATQINIAAPPITQRSLLNHRGVNQFVEFGFADVSTVSRVASLEPSEETLWLDLSETARRAIRRAKRLGYGVELVEWKDFLDEYYGVHCETYKRTGVNPHPRAYFEGIAHKIAPLGHAILRVGRAPDGRAVAFHNTGRFGESALYHTGCSETAHMDSGINHLLFWSAIIGSKAAGCRWYEIGEIFPGVREGKMHGLTRLKTSFGGEDHRYLRGTMVLTADAPRVANARFPSAQRKKAPELLDKIERDIRHAYEKGDLYTPDRICAHVNEHSREYADRLLATKLSLVRRHYPGGLAVDLCCATGGHLIALANDVERGIGIDFAARYVQRAQADAETHALRHLSFICSDAKRLPLGSGNAGLIYSLSSLYAIPKVEDVFAEVSRVLRPGGIAVLDLGNSRSLNTYCLRTGYTDWPSTFPITVAQMQQLCAANQLEVIEHRSFQLLPLWAGKPDWLWLLLHPAWRRLLQRRIGGRMLDEWLSSLPGIRQFAFRHLLVCRKAGG
jgi:ubiquinone/menaquinone biosynthesis C-methylase UbiE